MDFIDISIIVCLTEASSGPLAGVLSAIIVAAIGAVAGYFTYQQKKLCFKSRQGNSLTEAEQPVTSLAWTMIHVWLPVYGLTVTITCDSRAFLVPALQNQQNFHLQSTWGPCSPAALRKSHTHGLYTLPQLKPHSCCVPDVASEVAPLITY